ncbi:type II toxin-antitoxin system VapC family toxin [Acinetobacter puyangensis]|uniref:tRNA(fMet)-specific endonuclease VapC n=1 Tax=Acinetobacter puyangensis TaxID=1096779 RepID=A0A240E8G7_9GAMM|nr:PIN domain-containing protein [Acinetobacter puyangensis]SNX44811.1 tRNA(fMet)-specific endonuclease VapC [Acinetobacter puyangensis]
MDFRYLLDTNICSELIKNPQAKVAQKLFHIGTHFTAINWVVKAELRFGARLKNSTPLTQRVEALIHELNFIDFNHNLAFHYADIRTELTQKGELIGANDLWIAAHARSLDLCIVTNNVKEFSKVTDLRIENWF